MRLSIPQAIRLNYFSYALACGCTYPYLSIYFKETLHVSDQYLGLIMMIRPLMALIGQSFWSMSADSSGRRSHLAAGLVVTAAILCPLILLVPSLWMRLALLAGWAFFNAPINTLSDSITFDYLGAQGRQRFAAFRVFASAGFVVAVMLIGRLYDRTGISWQFPSYSVCACMAVVALWPIPRVPHISRAQGRQALRALLVKRNVRIFLIAVFLIETANAMAFTFLSVYCRQLGASNMQTGWVWAVGTLAEIVTMLTFTRVFNRLGVKNLLLIGFAAVTLRWFLFVFIQTWWQVYPVQLLHAFCLTYVYVGSVVFMDMEGHRSLRVTAQAFYSMFILNTAGITGSLLGGVLSQRVGYARMFLTGAAMALTALIILALFVRNPVPDDSDEETPA